MSIGENIKRLRCESGMSQEQLGEKLGKTRSDVSYYESGTIIPRMGVIEDLASIFGVSKSEIIEPYTSYAVVSLENELSDAEREIVGIMRKITHDGQRQLMIYARGIASTYSKEQ